MQSRWKPAISPDWRPPSVNGWSIDEVPEDLEVPDNVRKAWRLRTRKPNKNGTWAVNEMATFLHANGIAIGKDARSKIENQADFEWCTREPSRCHKRILLSAATRGRSATEGEPVVPAIMARRASQPARVVNAPRPGGCCGGRGR